MDAALVLLVYASRKLKVGLPIVAQKIIAQIIEKRLRDLLVEFLR
jgi:hypothetical protein